MGLLDLLGFGNKKEEVAAYKAKNAVILDVRTAEEFADGHIENAINIPLQVLHANIVKIQSWEKPVIACCRSGMRSGQATSTLREHGVDVINGGGWQSLEALL
jgi:phage shock protein E